ncbi:MAG: MFS transporter [Firmicutes bacterium]|nr:MFS transporter [Bacillota bacterium]
MDSRGHPGRFAVAVALAAIGIVMVAVTRFDIATVLKEVMGALGIASVAGGGLVSTIPALGDGITEPFMGRLADVVRRRHIMALGIFIYSAFTLLTGLATNLFTIGLFRFFVGVGEGMYIPSYFSFLGSAFHTRRGFFIGILGGLFTVGTALSPIGTAHFYLAFGHSWPAPFIIFGLIGLVLAGLVALVGRSGFYDGRVAGDHPPFRVADLLSRNMLMITVMMLLWGLTNAGFIGMYTLYLRHVGLTLSQAALIASICGWAAFATSCLGGWLSDQIGRRNTLLIFGFAALLSAYPLFVVTHSFWPALILGAIFQGSNGTYFPVGVAYAQDNAHGGSLGVHTGTVVGLGHIVAGFSGAVIGWCINAGGFPAVSYLYLASSAVMLAAVLVSRDHRYLAKKVMPAGLAAEEG